MIERLIFVLSLNSSFTEWERSGIISREIKVVDFLKNKFGRLLVVSFDANDIKNFPDYEFLILPKLGSLLGFPIWAALCILKIYISTRRIGPSMILTNQVSSAVPAVIINWFVMGKLVVRAGFCPLENSLSARKKNFGEYILSWINCNVGYRFAKDIILTSSHTHDFVRRRFGVAVAKKVVVIPNWIDRDAFKRTSPWQSRFNWPLFVGRFSEEKRIDRLAEVALFFGGIGLVGKGPLKQLFLEKLAHSKIEYTDYGMVANDRLPEIFNRFRFIVLCSDYEGCPKVLLEANACGCYVIGSNAKGIVELIDSQDVGQWSKDGSMIDACTIANTISHKHEEFSPSVSCKMLDVKDYCEKLFKVATEWKKK
jgi:glycosyltransferase involved in cell wall biosynthesis